MNGMHCKALLDWNGRIGGNTLHIATAGMVQEPWPYDQQSKTIPKTEGKAPVEIDGIDDKDAGAVLTMLLHFLKKDGGEPGVVFFINTMGFIYLLAFFI